METNQKISFLQLIPKTFRFIKNNWAANTLFFLSIILMYGISVVFFFRYFQTEITKMYVSQDLEYLYTARILAVQLLLSIAFTIIATGFIGYFSNIARGIKWSFRKTISESIKGFWRLVVSNLFAFSALWTIFAILGVASYLFVIIPKIGLVIAGISFASTYMIILFLFSIYLPMYIIEVIHKKNILDSIKRTEKMLRGYKLKLAGALLLLSIISILLTLPIFYYALNHQAIDLMYTPHATVPIATMIAVSLLFGFFMYNYLILVHYKLDKGITNMNTPDKFEELA